jgi:hypothetical protein
MSLFSVIKSETSTEEFQWHPHALLLFQHGNLDEIIGCVHANLASFGSTGSRVPYLEKRIALLAALERQDNPRFKQIAKIVGEFLNESLQGAKKQDEQFAAGIY